MATEPSSSTARPRWNRWAWAVGVAAMVAVALVLMFLLTLATDNRELYERYYARLLVVNGVVAAVLLGVITWVVARLLVRLRQQRFGSRLLVKLAAIFALVGLAPGLLIYVVSYQFVSRSIESWFDVKVEGALNAGLTLGQTTLEALSTDFGNQSRASAQSLVDTSNASAGLALERIRDQLGASEVSLWGQGGQLIASAGASPFSINPERPSAQTLREARSARVLTRIEGLDEWMQATAEGGRPAPARLRAWAQVPNPTVGLLAEARVLEISQYLPERLMLSASAVQEAYREYQERALARDGLRRMYIGTLTLSLFLAVFGAVLLAVLLGRQLARPLLLLAEGVRDVAAGDLSPKPVLQGRDELGGLTRSFAMMTQQLSDARDAVQHSMHQLDSARASVQTILDNLTAGVIVLDASGRVLQSNPGATRILRAPLAAYVGQPLADVPGLAQFSKLVVAQFESIAPEAAALAATHEAELWQQALELEVSGGSGPATEVSLVARGAGLPDGTLLLVFDDISEIVSAQRAQAWGEVARRLAHEIKNPLTPIQLSAERLQMKLLDKLMPTERLVLEKSVRTIVDQVDAMKRLVNEFRDYARLPAAVLVPVDLNALITDLMQLYSPENAVVPVRMQLAADCPPVRGDAQQLRQVIHNLLQNAQDATLSAGRSGEDHAVLIRTRWVSATGRVRLSVLDCGTGFPEHILQRAFEPYVTTKVRGTGLGLAVVKKIADDHAARVELANRMSDGAVLGAQVSLSFAAAP